MTTEQDVSLASWAPFFIGPVPAVIGLLSGGIHDNEDMSAINQFVSDTVAITPDAIELKNQWVRWWDGLSWYTKNVSTEAYDEARNRMKAFVIANQPTQQAKKDIKEVFAQGIDTEQMEGESKRSDDQGFFDAPDRDPEKPLIPQWVWISVGVSVLGGIALGIAKVVSNPMALVRR